MAGDFIGLTKKQQDATITTVQGDTATSVTGEASNIFFNESLDGAPRNEDLFAVRVLGRTGQVQWIKNIIKTQISSTDFQVKPTTDEEEASDAVEEEMADEIEDFLRGNFNTDSQSFDELLEIILDDVLDFDSGILELVANENGNLDQIIPRDGLTFTKNVKDNGLLPTPEDEEPAYFQFSPAAHAKNLFDNQRQGIDVTDLSDELHQLPFSRVISRETKEFSRSQIVWFQENSVSYQPYGIGRTQAVKNLAENMINGDRHRNRFFLENEYHKGFMSVGGLTSQDQAEKIKEKFSESAGNEHEMPVIGVPEDAEYISIDPEPEKMQFLESQKWYTRLVINAYGLNDVEAGFLENANKGISDDAKRKIFRQTTEPIMEMIERKFNNQILPKMQEYKEVDGNLRFEFNPQNRFLESLENEMINNELESGTLTLNEARRKKGKDDFGDLGEMPKTVFEELARDNPSWVAEQLTGIEDIPEGGGQGGGGLFQSFLPRLGEKDDDGQKSSGNGDSGSVRQSENEDEEVKENEEGMGSTPHDVSNYREAFKFKDELLDRTKDALRNERGFNDVPGIVEHKNEMKKDVAEVFQSINLEEELKQEFQDEKQDQSVLVNADELVEDVDLRERLASVLESNNLGALEMSAEHHEKEIEEETEERFDIPSETKVSISFDVMDTFTADIIRQQALSSATTIEDTIKDRLKNEILEGAEKGEGIDQITDRVSDTISDISDSNAELVARTETLSSSRKGSQALAESTDLIEGKEWLATDDSRTRAWHDAMDGQIVPKNEQFTVPKVGSKEQPSNYPRTARVVGEDQPFNCRCSQAPVLAEDMPDNVQQLEAEFDNVSVDLGLPKQKNGKCKKLEIWRKHSTDNEESFESFWKRVTSEYSKSEIAENYNLSKTTVYDWS